MQVFFLYLLRLLGEGLTKVNVTVIDPLNTLWKVKINSYPSVFHAPHPIFCNEMPYKKRATLRGGRALSHFQSICYVYIESK